MATSEKIGELYVDITGKDRGASAALDKVGSKADKASSKMKSLGDNATKAQGVIAKLMMPVALVTSISAAVRLIIEFANQAKVAREELERLGSSLNPAVESLIRARRDFSDTTKQGIAMLDESRAKQAELVAKYQEGLPFLQEAVFALRGSREESDILSRKAQEITDSYIAQGNALTESFIRGQKLLKADRDRAAAAAETAARTKEIAENAAEAEGRYSKIAELNEIILAANESQLDAADKTAAATLRQIDALTNALNAGPLQEGVAERTQAAINAILDAQLKADEKAHNARGKAEADLQAQRLRNLEEFDRALRNSLAGSMFGEGSISGGAGMQSLVAALGQISDKLGGAR